MSCMYVFMCVRLCVCVYCCIVLRCVVSYCQKAKLEIRASFIVDLVK